MNSRTLDLLADTFVGTIFAVDRFAARILKGWFTVSDLIIRGPKHRTAEPESWDSFLAEARAFVEATDTEGRA